MKYVIEKGIPCKNMKLRGRPGQGSMGESIWPIAQMEFGDSFFVKPELGETLTELQRRVAGGCWGVAHRLGKRTKTQQVDGGVRVWCVSGKAAVSPVAMDEIKRLEAEIEREASARVFAAEGWSEAKDTIERLTCERDRYHDLLLDTQQRDTEQEFEIHKLRSTLQFLYRRVVEWGYDAATKAQVTIKGLHPEILVNHEDAPKTRKG